MVNYDKYETNKNNDKFDDAQIIYNDEDILGTINKKEDIDWYRIIWDESGLANFWVDPLSDDLDVEVLLGSFLFNLGGFKILDHINMGKGNSNLIKFNVENRRPYYIGVRHKNGPVGSQYHLRCKNYPKKLIDLDFIDIKPLSKQPFQINEIVRFKVSVRNNRSNVASGQEYKVQVFTGWNNLQIIQDECAGIDIGGNKTVDFYLDVKIPYKGETEVIFKLDVNSIFNVPHIYKTYQWTNKSGNSDKAFAIRSYDGKTEVRREPDFYSSKYYGWIGFNEEVTILGEEGPFTKIEYSAGNRPKQGYVYTKCILPSSYKNKDKDEKSIRKWYNPYSDGWYMSQAFNDLDTNNQGHLGHDLINKNDQTVRAIYDGTVKKASLSGANGYMVEIEHNISGKKFYSFYSHMESKLKVKVNDIVKAGQELGRMGNSGGVPEHLHLGVYTGNFIGSPFGYMAKSKREHVINFSESTNNTKNRLAAKQNALLESGKCTRGGLRNTYYDFLEVIKSNGSILE